jgi:site-specific recombinase XerD
MPHPDFKQVKLFMLSYAHSADTYNAYRRDVERFCQWLWYVQKKNLSDFQYEDCMQYVSFFQKPPSAWISQTHAARFSDESTMHPNQEWRPFVSKIVQSRTSPQSIKAMFACLSTFCAFMVAEGVMNTNPVTRFKQKKQLVATMHNQRIKRRLSRVQWQTIIEIVTIKAQASEIYERHLFLLSTFYLLGLRISELSSHSNQTCVMSSFYKDRKGLWWYEAHGKGNKIREVAVPDAMLDALTRYRRVLGLSDLPATGELTPLLPKLKGYGGLGQRQIRHIISQAFDIAEQQLICRGEVEEAEHLKAATVHWLRHTAISDDVLQRPGEHVRDDVGHESLSTTSLYIDVLDEQRHASAKQKTLLPED